MREGLEGFPVSGDGVDAPAWGALGDGVDGVDTGVDGVDGVEPGPGLELGA
jgi:hypothetical protein